ncbi:MAG: hypothetical protein CVU05_14710 [Bacteroidetes bacterium HGW-Bacteroidetes-21]|nr:MAG: hypothetical protein CVU05_14710 [Bacteroidetes bacterium HGW-Bacteroidetes-21]
MKYHMSRTKSTIKDRQREKMLSQSKEQLVDTVFQLQDEVKQYEETLLQKTEEFEKLSKKYEELQKGITPVVLQSRKLSWVGRIVYALTTIDRPMQSSEIVDFIEKYDKTAFKNATDKSKYLSSFLGNAQKFERIRQYKLKGIRGHFYALPQWFDEDGNLKREYKEKEPIV